MIHLLYYIYYRFNVLRDSKKPTQQYMYTLFITGFGRKELFYLTMHDYMTSRIVKDNSDSAAATTRVTLFD